MAGRRARLGHTFNIGGDQAEADPLLDEAFYNSTFYETMIARDDPRCFIIGRTGSGKSAALTRLAEEQAAKVIRIVPEDLSMPYITNLDVVQQLKDLDVDLSAFWKALWRHIFTVEVIKHRYNVDSADSKASVLQNLRNVISRDAGKKQALAYLDEFDGRFWAETDERVKEITTSLVTRIEDSGSVGVTAGPARVGFTGSDGTEYSESERRSIRVKYQRIVNETQLARLNKMMDVLHEDVLKSEQDFVYIVIDDLDKDWVDSSLSNELIMALFKTVHDFKRVKNLKILVALRTNIFVHMDFGSAAGGQEEKFRSLVLNMLWNRDQLRGLMDERIRVAARRQEADVVRVSEILPNSNSRRGNAVDYILDRTLLRPRDFISFMRECLGASEGKGQVSWDAIKRAEVTYSENRLLALRDEWKLNNPGIDSLFEAFRRAPGRMDRAQITRILDECALTLADQAFVGAPWLKGLTASIYAGRVDDPWAAQYGPLVRLFYDIGFLGASMKGRRRASFSLDDELLINSNSSLDQVEFFYVAKAYHSVLEVETSDFN
ncbi:P-loop ATPase, Sll1717 family [Clavibacter sp. Sh2036]|uniref:P-loop ATPase, Sll1717 family n=1 Tax=Clavibacter sp. Sh2036 TaxID=3397677 RepID=UPI0039E16DA8